MPIRHDLAQPDARLLGKGFMSDMKTIEDIEAVFGAQPDPAFRRLCEAEHGQVVETGFLLEAVDPKSLGPGDTDRGAKKQNGGGAPGDASDSTSTAKLDG